MRQVAKRVAFCSLLILACVLVGCGSREKDSVVPPMPPASLQITLASLPDGTVGVDYSYTLSASNGILPYSWNIADGSLPDGLNLSSVTGEISGTPISEGTFTFTVQVADSAVPCQTADKSFSIAVVANPAPPLEILTNSLPTAEIGTPYNVTLMAAGGAPPYSWSLASGLLPAGLSLNSSTGEIGGIPETEGTYTFTAGVTDAVSNYESKGFSITVNKDDSLAIETQSLPVAALGTPYSAMLQATGGVTPYTWSITGGGLPDGLVLDSITGEISGTPTADGTFIFTVEVTDALSDTDARDLSIDVSSVAIHVPGDYATIQAAIDAAVEGDTVLVDDGVYTGEGNKEIDFRGKAITVRSKNGPENCVIDCENSGRGFWFHSSETRDSVLRGFTIQNGRVEDDNGGAIYCDGASPTIVGNIITDNSATGC